MMHILENYGYGRFELAGREKAGTYLKQILPIILAIILFGVVTVSFIPTGFVVKEFNYTKNSDLIIYGNYAYNWMINAGTLTSVRLDGSISADGDAKVYLKPEDYLIFDSSNIVPAVTPITIAEISKIVNETNKQIDISLVYKDGTDYDVDNNGIESLDGIIDLSVEATSFDLDYSNLCTKWEIFNQHNSSFICYGASDCCSLLDLVPTSGSWNESFNLNYGKFGAQYENIVTAQVIYADYSLDPINPYTEIFYSDLLKY